MKRTVLAIVSALVAVGLGLLFACQGTRELRIGVAVPLSGEQAALGQDVLNGVTLAVDQWNASGKLGGKKAVLLPMDDANDPAKAAETAYALCRKKPILVLGHVDSGCSIKAARIYQDHHVVMISPTSTNPALTAMGLDHVFRVCGRDDRQGRFAAVWLTKNQDYKTVGVIHDNSEYGKGLTDEFVSNYEFLSGRQVLFDVGVKRGDAAMEEAIRTCAQAKPDLVYFGGLYTQGAALLKNLRLAGVPSGLMSGDGCFGKPFIDAAGPDLANGTLASFYPDLGSLPGTSTQAFVKEYATRFGKDPGPFSLFGYVAADVGLTAVSQAGVPLNDRTVSDALHRITFKTLTGLLRFDDKGDPMETCQSMWLVENGAYKELGP
jgi:branched-chain amino acid transport system substrate-binding protein